MAVEAVEDIPQTPKNDDCFHPRRLIANVIDDFRRDDPEKVFACIPKSTFSKEEGIYDVTYKQFANAVDCAAIWLKENLPASARKTFAYVGPNDLRYGILVIAAQKTNLKIFLPSIHLGVDDLTQLLSAVRCGAVLHSNHLPHEIKEGLIQTHTKSVLVPGLEEWLENPHPKPFPPLKDSTDFSKLTFAIVHTSGLHGRPKIVELTQDMLTDVDNINELSTQEREELLLGKLATARRFILAFPLFHPTGLYLLLAYSAFIGSIPVIPPSLSPKHVSLAIEYGKAKAAVLSSCLVEELCRTTRSLGILTRLDLIVYTGAPLSSSIGERIIDNGREVQSYYSLAEFPALKQIAPSSEDWGYNDFKDADLLEFRHIRDDLHELVVSGTVNHVRGVTSDYPDQDEYRTGDLFVQHSESAKQHLWKFRVRVDDIIVLSVGERIDPTPFEEIVNECPHVRSAVVLGNGRYQPSLLVEVKDKVLQNGECGQKTSSVIGELWSFIERANQQHPPHARITKNLILLASPDKPIARSWKGAPVRSNVTRQYQSELDSLYASSVDLFTDEDDTIVIDSSDTSLVVITVQDIVKDVSDLTELNGDENFFQIGVDSISALEIVRRLNTIFSLSGDQIFNVKLQQIYSNPTLQSLTTHLCSLIPSPELPTESTPKEIRAKSPVVMQPEETEVIRETTKSKENEAANKPKEPTESTESHEPEKPIELRDVAEVKVLKEVKEKRKIVMQKALEEYAARLLIPKPPLPSPKVAVVTGTTRGLGHRVVKSLANSKYFRKIYCLNRRDFSPTDEEYPGSCVFLKADLNDPKFGLDDETLLDLQTTVTHVIHNAWQVDFNLNFQSFQSQLEGTLNLINLCAESNHKPRLVFLSSATSVSHTSNADESHGLLEEAILDDFERAKPLGYSESKHIAEKLIYGASSTCGIPVTVLRLAQVAGSTEPEDGMWHQRDWFPRLIKSSAHLGCIPYSIAPLNKIDWIPINTMARIITEITTSETAPTAEVLHILNPARTTWPDLLPPILSCFTKPLKVVSFPQWMQALRLSLENTHSAAESEASNPALQLFDFFEDMALSDQNIQLRELDTTKAQQRSPVLRELGPVRPEWMALWMRQWGFGT